MRKLNSVSVFSMSFLACLISSGCTTMGKSVGAGAAAGGMMGAGVGALADPGSDSQNRFRNVVIGAAVGSAVGAGAGFMMGEHLKNEKQEAVSLARKGADEENSRHIQSTQAGAPRLISPRTEARWVSDQIRGNVFVPGHFEYVIVEGAKWETGK